MKSIVGFAAVVVLIPHTGAAAGEAYPGATVQLDALPEGADGSILLRVSAPYPGRHFRIAARGPAGTAFEVAAGALDERGAAQVALAPRSGLSLAGVNGAFQAAVTPAAGGADAVSPWALVRLGSAAASLPAWPGFAREASPALNAAGAALAGELPDLDGDGDADVVLITGDDAAGAAVRFLETGGDDGFRPFADRAPEALVPAARVVAVVDVDSNGTLDAVVGTGEAAAANALLLGDGAGGFAAAAFPAKPEPAGRTNAIVPADFDGDGDADLFLAGGVAGTHGVPAVPQTHELLLGDGDGGFVAGELPAELAPVVTRAPAAGDVDLDGDLDVLAGNTAADHLLLNGGAARFVDGSAALPPAADSTYGVELADLDGDGDLDVLYANAMFSPVAAVQLTNLGGAQGGVSGSFETAAFPALVAGQSPVRLGVEARDFDGDGDVDACFGTHDLGNGERPDLYLNQGGLQGGERGTFAPAASFEASAGIYAALPAGDVDGDGDLDLLAFSTGTTLPDSVPEGYVLRNPLFAAPNAPLAFLRGDANQDLTSDLSDAVFILGYLFLGGTTPACLRAADVDDSGVNELTDAIALLGHLFLGATPPAAPFPGLDDDPTPGGPGCDRVEVFAAAR